MVVGINTTFTVTRRRLPLSIIKAMVDAFRLNGLIPKQKKILKGLW